MRMDTGETLQLAEMLRIRLSESDAERLADDMSSILDYVRTLDEVDVEGVDPMGVGLGGFAVLRADEPASCLSGDDLVTLSGGAFDPQAGVFTTKAVFS